jgi:polyphosphate kinase 2 (PPK2 family)
LLLKAYVEAVAPLPAKPKPALLRAGTAKAGAGRGAAESRRAEAATPPLDDAIYEREKEKWQGRLALLSRKKRFAGRAVVLALEGMDAAGKGGAIRRLTQALDVRQYEVVPVSAPTEEEKLHPYLWRFWKHIPTPGRFEIFDRSWYGRVLVERVRGFAAPADWRRAYDEINEFELELAEHRTIVMKFWLSVSPEEQLRRFVARDRDPLKRFKVDPEDWINREYFQDYEVAARAMLDRTDTAYAPWTVVQADDKYRARLAVLKAVCEGVEKALAA